MSRSHPPAAAGAAGAGRVARAALALAGCLLLGAGCGSAPPPVGPGGVDGLTVPTPSPRPTDFVAGIRDPWLAWTPGGTWEYATTDDRGRSAILTVRVLSETRTVDGVPATVLEGRVRSGPGRRTEQPPRGPVTRRFAAQDRAGNVWLLGGESPGERWRAGRDGALAGLLMPATPRRGDGFVQRVVPGTAEEVVTVLGVDAALPEIAGGGTGLLLERRSTTTGAVVREYYRRGVGLVASTGGARELRLRDAPDADPAAAPPAVAGPQGPD